MKRLDLVQLTIIIVGIFSAFSCLETLPSFFVYMIGWFDDGLAGSYSSRYLVYTILLLALTLIFSIYIIKYSKQIAEYLCNKANMDAAINFSINKKELLYILFIAMGIYGLIKNIPPFLRDGYEKITQKDVESVLSPRLPTGNIYMEGITIGLYFLLMYYANVFSEFLAAKIKNTEPEDEINGKNES
jgi:hypothetical protein